jgi:hypothetical protein
MDQKKENFKTIQEWFSGLPDPYKNQAIVNTNFEDLNRIAESEHDAIMCAFVHGLSEEGHDYWKYFIVERYGYY